MPDATCPDEQSLSALLALDADDAHASAAHVQACTKCQQRLAELALSGWQAPRGEPPSELRAAEQSQLLSRVKRSVQSGDLFVGTVRQTEPSPDRSGFGRVGASLTSELDALQLPRQIGHYQVEALLGAGGIGVVYRARDPALQRDVAIKLLRVRTGDDPVARARFLREAQAAAAIRDDHVVAIFGIGEHEHQPYLVMEYLAGGSLADRLGATGRLGVPELLDLGIAVGSALHSAHARGVIHRDVKPANVLLDSMLGRFKLADFGLAKALDEAGLTCEGTIVGTPEFLSPEQALGKPADARSDLFALGTLLYSAAAGESPFRTESVATTIERVCRETAPSLRSVHSDLPESLVQLVEQLMAIDPAQRPATAAEAVGVLRRIAADLRRSADESVAPTVVMPAATPATPPAPLRSWGHAPLLGAFCLAVLVGSLSWYFRPLEPATAPSATPVPAPGTTRFSVIGESRQYSSLAAATASAPDGAVIEISASGEIAAEPIRITGKQLTIQAAPGARCALVLSGSRAGAAPLLASDSALHLKQIELRSVRPVATAAGTAASPLVEASGPSFTADRCAFIDQRGGDCLLLAAVESRLSHCRCSSPAGTGIAWRAARGKQLDVEHCWVESARSLVIEFAASPIGEAAPRAVLRNTTFAGDRAVESRLDPGAAEQTIVHAEECRFDVRHLLAIVWLRPPPPAKSMTLDGMRQLLLKRVAWSDHRCEIAASGSLLSAAGPRFELMPLPRRPRTIDDWERLWNHGPSGSVLRDFTRATGSAPLAPQHIGADLSATGPGSE